MAGDKKQLILVVVPAVAVVLLLVLTSIAIILKLRRSSQRSLLPMTQKPRASFTQNHLNTSRGWEEPAATTAENSITWSTFKTDLDHIPLLTQPVASHQPQRLAKGAWQQFQEKQQQRAMQAHTNNKPLEKWHLQPKGPIYWREVGREMQVRKTWWEKTKDRVGL